MKCFLFRLFGALLALSPVIRADAAVVLQYHHISDTTPRSTSIRPELFMQHMAFLQSDGFTVLPLPELVAKMKQGEALPDKVVAITFDDGYISVFETARPILERFNYPYTVFVTTDQVGSNRLFMTWDQLRALRDSGATIANHSKTHAHFIRQRSDESEADWLARIDYEIRAAESALEQEMGFSPRLLAYPFGEYVQQIQALPVFAELGITAFAQNSSAFDEHVDWLAVPRFAFGGFYGSMDDDFPFKARSMPYPESQFYLQTEQGERLQDPLLPLDSKRPAIVIELSESLDASRVTCYASNSGLMDIEIEGSRIRATPTEDVRVGRSRYNCTYPGAPGWRFYWHSEVMYRRQSNGDWYPE